jgi:hypothetical protein
MVSLTEKPSTTGVITWVCLIENPVLVSQRLVILLLFADSVIVQSVRLSSRTQ